MVLQKYETENNKPLDEFQKLLTKSYEQECFSKNEEENSIICEPSSCNVETLTMERFLLSSHFLFIHHSNSLAILITN